MLQFGLPHDIETSLSPASRHAPTYLTQRVVVPVTHRSGATGRLLLTFTQPSGLARTPSPASSVIERRLQWVPPADQTGLPTAEDVFAAYQQDPAGAAVLQSLQDLHQLRLAERAQVAAMEQVVAASTQRLAALNALTRTLQAAVAHDPRIGPVLQATLAQHPWHAKSPTLHPQATTTPSTAQDARPDAPQPPAPVAAARAESPPPATILQPTRRR